MLLYPKLTPPEFKVSYEEERSRYLHYFSIREGLKEFVRGMIQGLGLIYNTIVQIELLEDRDKGDNHEIFKVSW